MPQESDYLTVNKVILVGYIKEEVQITDKETPSGYLSLVTSTIRYDEKGKAADTSQIHKVLVEGGQTVMANRFKRGDLVTVQGRLCYADEKAFIAVEMITPMIRPGEKLEPFLPVN